MRIQFTVTDEELKILTKKAEEGNYLSISDIVSAVVYKKIQAMPLYIINY